MSLDISGTLVNFIILWIATIVLAFWTPALDVFNFPKQMILVSGALSLLPIYLNSVLVNKQIKIDVFDAILLTLIFLVIVSSFSNGIWRSEVFWGSYSRANGTITLISFALVALIIGRISFATIADKFFTAVGLLLLILVIYGIIQATGRDPIPWTNPYNPIILTVGNPNFASSLLAIFSILNVQNVFKSLKNEKKFLAFSLSLLTSIGIALSIATKSIQGVVMILAAVFLALCLYILSTSLSARFKVVFTSILFGMTCIPILGILGVGPLGEQLYQRTLQVRFHYWAVALKIMRDYPILGVGPDQYGEYYLRYRSKEFVDIYGPSLFTNNAHNSVLQWGVSIGIIGMALLLILYILLFYRYFRMIRKSTNFTFNLQKQVVLIALIVFLSQSLISIEQIGIGLIGWLLLGLSISGLRETSFSINSQRGSKKFASTVITNLVLFSFIVFLAPFSSFVRWDINLREALQIPPTSENTIESQIRAESITKASKVFLGNRDYIAMASRNLLGGGQFPNGVQLLRDSVKQNPRNADALLLLSQAEAKGGDVQSSIISLESFLIIDPLNEPARLDLSRKLISIGRIEDARVHLFQLSASNNSTIREEASKILGTI